MKRRLFLLNSCAATISAIGTQAFANAREWDNIKNYESQSGQSLEDMKESWAEERRRKEEERRREAEARAPQIDRLFCTDTATKYSHIRT